MKKLAYIPFAANVVLLLYMVLFIALPRNNFFNDYLAFCWGDLNMQYISPAIWIALPVSFVVPFIRINPWVRVITPLLAIGNLILLFMFWTIFQFP